MTNASQTQPSTSHTQLILVLSSSSLGRRKIHFGDRRTRPSPSRTVQTPRAKSRHPIFHFHSSHQVFVLGPHSRQYFRTSLRSLLTLDYVPRKVKIPTYHVPHECRFCPRVNPSDAPFGAPHQRPFEYILAIPRSRGRPRRETVLPVSSESESESE